MDYEQRYKEALDEAKTIHKAIKKDLKPVIEQIFPELKESEDERIRKELTDYIKSKFENSCSPAPSKNILGNWIAWLEKQGEQKPVEDSLTLEEFENAFITKAKQYDIDLPNRSWDIYALCKELYSLKHKPKQGEQKSADKVAPKFKVGDWISDGNITIQIEAIKNNCYSYCGDCTLYSIKTADKVYHLWTIQDAKDGDVLFHSDSASNGIFIFKELLKYEFGEKVICYCDYDSEDHFCLGEHHTCCWADAKILHPATKEQRDTLFEKMKLEGYRWDEDEKKVIRFERFERRKESDFAFKENENGVIKFVHKKSKV